MPITHDKERNVHVFVCDRSRCGERGEGDPGDNLDDLIRQAREKAWWVGALREDGTRHVLCPADNVEIPF